MSDDDNGGGEPSQPKVKYRSTGLQATRIVPCTRRQLREATQASSVVVPAWAAWGS